MKTRYPLLMVFLLLSSLLFAQEQKEKKITNFEEDNLRQRKLEKTTQIIGANAANNVVIYDFTTSASKFYGGSAGAAILEISVDGDTTWGMVAGDLNISGVVTNADKDSVDANIDITGYLLGDTNMSGVITNADKDDIDSNIDKATQVPN